MADIKINQDTGELAIPEPGGGYRVFKRDEYKMDADNNRVAIPDGSGFVMYDLPAQKRPLFTKEGSLRALGLGTRSSIEGLASPLTFLGDVTNSLLNLPIRGINEIAGTGIPEFPLPSQELNRTLIEDAGFPEEATESERFMSAINRGAGGAIATMGVGTLASSALNAPRAAATFSANPLPQAIGGATGGAAAEGTRQGLQDVQLFENPTADNVAKSWLSMAAGVLGGAGGYGAARLADATTRSLYGAGAATMNMLTEKGRQQIAGQTLRQASGDPDSLAGRLSDAPPSKIPGVRPTTAQALGGDSQLSALELGMRNDPALRHAFDIRAAENQTARSAALDAMFPAGAGSVDDLAAAVRSAWEQADDAGRQEIMAATQRVQQQLAALGDNVDPQAAGQVIREGLQDVYRASKARTSAAYQAIDPGNATSLSGQAVYDRVAPLIERNFANSTLGTPKELLPILERLRNSSSLPLGQLDGIRQDLGNIAGLAARSGDNRLASVAGQMADEIGSYADDAAAAGRGFTPEQAAAYKAARGLRLEQGQTFERGAVGATLKRGAYGEYKISDSGVPAELFFKGPGSPEATAQFVKAAGGRSQATRALENYIATQLRQTVIGPDGAIDANRLLRFISDHNEALAAFPELRSRIQSISSAQGLADQAALQATARRSEMAGSPLNQFLTKNPTDAVNAIVMGKNSESAAARIMEQLRGNTASVAAFKRSVVDWFKGKIENAGIQPASGEPLQSYAKVKSILDAKLPTLSRIFSREEMKALRDFAAQMETEARVMGARPMGSDTVNNLATRYLVERASAGALPMTGPNVTALTPSLGWLTRPVNDAIKNNLVQAMLDPQTAAAMVNLAGPLPVRDLSSIINNAVRGVGLQTGIQAQAAGAQQNSLPRYLRELFGSPLGPRMVPATTGPR